MYHIRLALLSATALAIASSTSAFSADLVVKAKAPPAQTIQGWAGFYFGAHVGYGIAAADSSTRSDVLIEELRASGAQGGIYGLHGGYNHQIGRAVLGVEVDWSKTNLSKSNRFLSVGLTGTTSNEIDWLGSVRGRFGLVADRALVYATLGVAWSRSEFNGFSPFAPAGFQTVSGRETSTGAVFGGGIEWALGNGFSARAEYLRYVFGDSAGPTRFVTPPSSDLASYRYDSVDVIRAGITYHPFQRTAAAPVAGSSPYNWTGAYVGGHVGYGIGTAGTSVTDDVAAEDLTASGPRGGLFGGQLGYNGQFGRAVLGIEADWSQLDASRRSSISVGAVSYTAETEVKWLASARGRFGITAEQLMIYATVGAAWAGVEFSGTNQGVAAAFQNLRISKTASGIVFGGGAEWALGNGVSVRAEYLRYAFGATTGPTRFDPGPGGQDELLLGRLDSVDVVRVGANYHFHHAALSAPSRANWNGVYVGAHGGYAIAAATTVTSDDVISENTTAAGARGGLLGGQIGFNRQFNWLVVGAEGDASWVDASRSAQFGTALAYTASQEIKGLASLRGRAGIAADNLLLYATAGAGWMRANFEGFNGAVAVPNQTISISRTKAGLAFGAGAEWALWNGWSARAEYLRYVFGLSGGTTEFAPLVPDENFAHRLDSVDVVRVGLNYRIAAR